MICKLKAYCHHYFNLILDVFPLNSTESMQYADSPSCSHFQFPGLKGGAVPNGQLHFTFTCSQ
jgi:hypothetical protein